ncbi:hypothetical protein MA16_Dca023030 [Dendrobium catenatum]|uniref:Uncharacterized protein n=1 Tax=Dendrobium catenatum TaxID=906689 RepID=A0A2I0WQJ3_9ASPA|nr:hypothetical protein MA16_Dca023030 [Dendrobium catenatum]
MSGWMGRLEIEWRKRRHQLQSDSTWVLTSDKRMEDGMLELESGSRLGQVESSDKIWHGGSEGDAIGLGWEVESVRMEERAFGFQSLGI